MTLLWGTSGIRKVFHPHTDGFTPELALNLGLALGTYVNGGTIVVAKDIRTASLPVEFAIISGLVSVGCKIIRIGVTTTPTLAFATGKLGADAGVMITASHNPPEYIGVKFWNPSGLGFSSEQEQDIEEIFKSHTYKTTHWDEIGTVIDINDINARHVAEIMKQVNIDPEGKHFSVVVDPGNGSSCEIAPMLLKEFGCRITTINAQPDGFFPGRFSEPSPENVKMVAEFIKAAKGEIELGIALDGDADRVVFLDEKGNYIDPIRILALLTKKKAESLPLDLRYGFSIVTPINSSTVLEDVVAPYGAKVVYCPVGDIKVAHTMKQIGSLIGGEDCGTIIWPDFHYGPDSLLTIAKVLELLQQEEKPFSQIMADIPEYPYITSEIRLAEGQMLNGPTWEALKQEIIAFYREKIPHNLRINEIDGVRFDCNIGWVLIRPSGTSPLIRIAVESRIGVDQAKKMLEDARNLICGLIATQN